MTPVDDRAVFFEAASASLVETCLVVEQLDRELQAVRRDRPAWARAVMRGAVSEAEADLLRSRLDAHVVIDASTPPHQGRAWSVEVLHTHSTVDTVILGPQIGA